MSSLGIRVNTKNIGISQYADLTVNSLCVFNGVLLAGTTGGVLKQSGNSDNASTDILAFFQTPSVDLGSNHNKIIRCIDIDGNTEGDIDVAAVYDNDKVDAKRLDSLGILDQKTARIYANHEDYGRSIGVEVRNVNGSDFTIDSIDCLVKLHKITKITTSTLGRVKVTPSALTISATSV
jgi:hypothetical protein